MNRTVDMLVRKSGLYNALEPASRVKELPMFSMTLITPLLFVS